MFDRRPRIIDVERKPIKCPVCKSRVVDIIYGTGDMTEVEYFLKYRRVAITFLVALLSGSVSVDVNAFVRSTPMALMLQ